MPIYEYRVKDGVKGCPHCSAGFEYLQRVADKPLTACPQCGAAVEKVVSAPAIGRSRSGFDDRARSAGFHKLQRHGKGEYEWKY